MYDFLPKASRAFVEMNWSLIVRFSCSSNSCNVRFMICVVVSYWTSVGTVTRDSVSVVACTLI